MAKRRQTSRQNRRFWSVRSALKRTIGIAFDAILGVIIQALLALILARLSC